MTVTRGDGRSALARSGLVAKGVLYLVLGVLALRVASGDASSRSVSKDGAIETVARQPFGQWLLGLLTVGLFALAAWRFLQAATGDPVEGDEASDRAGFALKGALYLATAVSALAILLANLGQSSGRGGGGGTEQRAAGALLDLPAGPFIVVVLGLAVAGYGAYVVWHHAVQGGFLERLAVSGDRARAVEGAGRVGYGALGSVCAAVGVFFVVAGFTHDPDDATGLSGLLADLAGNGLGQAALWAVALGLFLYGAYSVAEARYRRAT